MHGWRSKFLTLAADGRVLVFETAPYPRGANVYFSVVVYIGDGRPDGSVRYSTNYRSGHLTEVLNDFLANVELPCFALMECQITRETAGELAIWLTDLELEHGR